MSKNDGQQLWMKVPAAGKKYFGFGRDKSYEEAKPGGLIPAVRSGRLLIVPVAAMERRLETLGETPAEPAPTPRRKRRKPAPSATLPSA